MASDENPGSRKVVIWLKKRFSLRALCFIQGLQRVLSCFCLYNHQTAGRADLTSFRHLPFLPTSSLLHYRRILYHLSHHGSPQDGAPAFLIFSFFFNFIYLFRLCWVFMLHRLFSRCSEGAYSLIAVHSLLIAGILWLQSPGSKQPLPWLSSRGSGAPLLRACGCSQVRNQTRVSCTGRWILPLAAREAHLSHLDLLQNPESQNAPRETLKTAECSLSRQWVQGEPVPNKDPGDLGELGFIPSAT